jgi:YegS/Rv2252/BmrU family lipid kinase
MRICVIFNPAAKGERARHFRRHLDRIGADCVLKPTGGPGGGRVLAREAVGEGYDTVVAAGGDGTLNEVLNGIGDAPEGFARARLAVLPLGTINVFARELGVRVHLRSAWETIKRGRELAIDLPLVEYSASGGTRRRYFAQLAGAGLDARAVELVDWQMKRRVGFVSYLLAAVKALLEKQSLIAMTGNGFSAAGEQVLIGNGRFYGGPLVVFPKANLRDGLLDVCLYPRLTWWTPLACLCGLATGRLARTGGARHFQTESLTLNSPTRTALQLDGERVGELPARFSVQRQGLRVIVP